MTQKVLIKTDKNGTQYFHHRGTCGRCNGTGIVACYIPINGGECFECWGSGVTEWDSKEYTPEYEAKLQAQREKRFEKKKAAEMAKASEKNAKFFENNGFTPDGKTYFVLGNTYDAKDELKAKGAKWDNASRHWHMSTKPEGFETLEFDVTELYDSNYAGVYEWNSWKRFDYNEDNDNYISRIEKAEEQLKAKKSTSTHVGTVGEKLEVVVTYTHTSSWENSYGGWLNHASVTNLHTFKDEHGNVFTWKTDKYIEAEYGTKMTLKGTVKSHDEYKGIKQTVMTRCKVEEVK